MDNPFMIGDLVHIPKGVILYAGEKIHSPPSPSKVNDKPRVGLVLKRIIPEFYTISVGEEEYVIRKEDLSLITRKALR